MSLSLRLFNASPSHPVLTSWTSIARSKKQSFSNFNFYSRRQFDKEQNGSSIQGSNQSPVRAKDSWANILEILVEADKKSMEYVFTRLIYDAQLLCEILPLNIGLQTVINATAPRLLIWVEGRDGEILAQSASLDAVSLTTVERMSSAKTQSSPEIHKVGQRFLILCSGSLKIEEKILGKVFIAQDVTSAQCQVISALRSLALVCIMEAIKAGASILRVGRVLPSISP